MISEHPHQLYSKLEDLLGGQDAGTLMGCLPPVGWADVATREDLRNLEGRLDARMDALGSRLEVLDNRLDAMERRLEARMGEMEARIEGRGRSLFLSLVGLQMTAAALVVCVSHGVITRRGSGA